MPPGLGELSLELDVFLLFEPLRLVQIRGLKGLFDLGHTEDVAPVGRNGQEVVPDVADLGAVVPDLTGRISPNALAAPLNCPTLGKICQLYNGLMGLGGDGAQGRS